MALRNPYSAYARTGDEASYSREALIRALEPEPEPPPVLPQPMTARPRTPTRPIEQTREALSGPGGRTQAVDEPDAPTTNPFGGDRFADDRQGDGYSPTPAGGPDAQPNTPPHVYNPQRGFELVDAYDDPYQRRGGYGGLEPTRRRISEGLLSSGEPYTMVSGAFGMLDAYMRRRAESAPTDFNIADARNIISQAHQDAFGREIDPAYLDEIVRGQGWQDGDRYLGDASLRYVLDAFDQQSGGALSRPGTETEAETAATPSTTMPAAAGGGGAPGGLPFEGFDFNAQDDGHQRANSAKYSYAAAVREAPPLTDTSKAGYEAWMREHIAPRMAADGHRIIDFEGDRFNVESASGNGWVDGLRGAGGERPGFAWQPDDVGGGASGGGTITGASGATTKQDAYNWLKQNADPSWTREEMQAAINAAFADVPGFVEGYAGDAVFEDGKLDLVTNFEGPGATWSDNLSLIPLHGGGASPAGAGGGTTTGLNLAPGASLAAPLGNSDVYAQVQAAIQRLMNGTSTRDELIGALG